MLQAKQGVSFRFSGTVDPFIQPWSPYKQLVAHQQGPNEIWVGDGTAILQKNWDKKDRLKECMERCRKAIGQKGTMPIKAIMGIRPYAQGSKLPYLFERLGKHTWLATGAGKMGTICAGDAARRIIDATS
jgi:hypothetical protein